MLENNQKNIKHGLRHHRLYDRWKDMIRRCNNPKTNNYHDYGGRGIKVCKRWLDIKNFIEDMYPSFIEGLTLDRKENDKDYSKDNCRWVNQNIQTRNTRLLKSNNTSGYRGVSWHKLVKKWSSTIGVNKKRIVIGYFIDKIDAAEAYDNYVINNNLEHTKNFS